MPFVPVPNVVMVEIRMLWALQKIENTLYFDFGAEPVAGDMLALGSALLSWWGDNLAPLISTTVSLSEIVITSLVSETAPQTTTTPTTPLVGLNTSPSLPNNVSLAISFRTTTRGRSFRGRNFFPGLTEGQVVGNEVESSVVADLILAYDVLKEPTISSLAEWVVVSRFSGVDPDTGVPIPRTTGIATHVTTVVVVDRIIDSMRRRLPGRGQ